MCDRESRAVVAPPPRPRQGPDSYRHEDENEAAEELATTVVYAAADWWLSTVRPAPL